MKTAKKIRLYTSLTVLVISLVLVNTAGAATVNTPMTEDLDANSFDIFGVTDLDVDGDATVMGTLTVGEQLTTIGPELLADPGFDDANEWSGGGVWTIASSSAQGGASPGTLTEANPFTVKANTTYLVEVDIGVSVVDVTLSLGGVTPDAFSDDSTFWIETTDTNSLSISKPAGGPPCIIAGMSIKEVGPAELGDTRVYLDLSVDEDIDANNLTTTDDANIGGDLLVNGALDVAGNIDATSFETTRGGFKDEDNMASDSATAVASQQSIKKYVDDNVGQIVQVVNTQTGAVASGTGAIPNDDTIPQKTEGDEYMTLAITPKSATNKLKIDVVLFCARNGDSSIGVALFQDTTSNALAAALDDASAFNRPISVKFTHYMDAGTTSETTFKVRAGTDSTATLTVNGASGARKYGGVMASSITITEIKV